MVGLLLIALPFVSVPSHSTQAYQVPKSEVMVDGWMPLAAVAPATSMAKGADLKANDSLNIQVNATGGKNINFFVKGKERAHRIILPKCYHTKQELDCTFNFRVLFCF